ncbi:LacI family DNA-binding transcriptional regulator [Kiritimatiellaeota bacterium B1221]|nr:LacI family DNA-binding transcriptional regulator [Kiritimatiellaeota bacterium B1221]
MRSPTVTEIAEALGLDKSTVSRGLRGDPKVKKATRDKIRKYAEERGYQRDPNLSALSEYRWRKQGERNLMNWGFLVPELGSRYEENQRMLSLCKQFAHQAGYLLNEIVVKPEMGTSTLNRILYARNIRGMIVNHLYRSDSVPKIDFSQLNTQDTQWVYCGNFFFEPRGMRVVENTFKNTQTVLQKIHTKGFRRVGFVFPRFMRGSRDMVRFRAACLAFCDERPEMMIKCIEVEDAQKVERYRIENKGLDVLLLSYMVIREKLPPEAFALPYALLQAPAAAPNASGIYRVQEDMALTATDLLDYQCRRIHHPQTVHPYTILIEGKWQEGRSLSSAAR